MSFWYFVLPGLFAIIAFFLEWKQATQAGRGVMISIVESVFVAAGTFLLIFLVIYLRESFSAPM